MSAPAILFWALSAVAVLGAALVTFTRDVTRLVLGLGAFLLAVAGFFALYGFGFLALAQLFVYVGGVLVLVLFAIMLVHRSTPGSPALESRHDSLAAIACLGLFGFIVVALQPLTIQPGLQEATSPGDLGAILLGDMLPHFELAGILLLAALVAVVAVSAGGER
jgi:NADH:ubiquinone oxidoreductase subunit 6 (subunit J)